MFAETSPTALTDADARWAHSAYLQVAAETGVMGVVLLGTLLSWVFGALFRSRQDIRLIVIGTAAATALAVHAAIDYVAHFPAVVIIAALLAGLASARTGSIHLANLPLSSSVMGACVSKHEKCS
jgi:O-antigen ligase